MKVDELVAILKKKLEEERSSCDVEVVEKKTGNEEEGRVRTVRFGGI